MGARDSVAPKPKMSLSGALRAVCTWTLQPFFSLMHRMFVQERGKREPRLNFVSLGVRSSGADPHPVWALSEASPL